MNSFCFILYLTFLSNIFLLSKSTPALGDFVPKLNKQFKEQEKISTIRINEDPSNISAYSSRGDARMFLGAFSGARDDYEKMIELDPKLEISHWRLGIAYFYLSDFKKAAHQFEIYHQYDNVDRENGIWRFMSQYKTRGLGFARDNLLLYQKTDRPPYPWLYEMFAGKCKPEDVFLKIKESGFPQHYETRVLFHAHLYVGIYLELTNEKSNEALTHLSLAKNNKYGSSTGTYMWQIARLHHDLLQDLLQEQTK